MEKELESQIHLFHTYEDLKAHALDLAARRSPTSEAYNLEESESIEFVNDAGELCRLEKQDGKWVSKNPTFSPKGSSQKLSPSRCFRCGRTTHRISDRNEREDIFGKPTKPEK